MEQANARTDGTGQRNMVCTRCVRCLGQRGRAVPQGSAAELAAKSTGEYFVAGESGREGDFKHRLPRRDEGRRRLLQAQAFDETLGRLAQNFSKLTVEMKARQAGPASEAGELTFAVEIPAKVTD